MPGDSAGGKVYFDCTEGGVANLGQVYEFDPGSQTIKLIYQSTSGKTLANPDNVVIVPKTGDIFLQEDSDPEHFVRGLTPDGKIYDFARTITKNTEFCGGCFSPDGTVFFLGQQGARRYRAGSSKPERGHRPLRAAALGSPNATA